MSIDFTEYFSTDMTVIFFLNVVDCTFFFIMAFSILILLKSAHYTIVHYLLSEFFALQIRGTFVLLELFHDHDVLQPHECNNHTFYGDESSEGLDFSLFILARRILAVITMIVNCRNGQEQNGISKGHDVKWGTSQIFRSNVKFQIPVKTTSTMMPFQVLVSDHVTKPVKRMTRNKTRFM